MSFCPASVARHALTPNDSIPSAERIMCQRGLPSSAYPSTSSRRTTRSARSSTCSAARRAPPGRPHPCRRRAPPGSRLPPIRRASRTRAGRDDRRSPLASVSSTAIHSERAVLPNSSRWIPNSRRSSSIGRGWSSTRRSTSTSESPPYPPSRSTTSSAADCCPRRSPPRPAPRRGSRGAAPRAAGRRSPRTSRRAPQPSRRRRGCCPAPRIPPDPASRPGEAAGP